MRLVVDDEADEFELTLDDSADKGAPSSLSARSRSLPDAASDFELSLDDGDADDDDAPSKLSARSRSLPDAASDFDFSLASSGITLQAPHGDDDDHLEAMSDIALDLGEDSDAGELEFRAYRLPFAAKTSHAGSSDSDKSKEAPPAGDTGETLQRILRSLAPANVSSTVEVMGDMALVATTSELHEKLENVLLHLARALQQRPTFLVKAYWLWLNHRDRDTFTSQPTNQPLQAILSRADESGSPVFQASLTCCEGHTGRLAASTVIQENASAAAKASSVRLDVTPVGQPDDDRGVFLCLKTRIGPGAMEAHLEATCCVRLGQETLIGAFPTPTRKTPSGSASLCLIVRVEGAA